MLLQIYNNNENNKNAQFTRIDRKYVTNGRGQGNYGFNYQKREITRNYGTAEGMNRTSENRSDKEHFEKKSTYQEDQKKEKASRQRPESAPYLGLKNSKGLQSVKYSLLQYPHEEKNEKKLNFVFFFQKCFWSPVSRIVFKYVKGDLKKA